MLRFGVFRYLLRSNVQNDVVKRFGYSCFYAKLSLDEQQHCLSLFT